ncbi:PREDICTED: indole-3-acetaldehyde oxidase [Tarenaya hassleriana]|uniref:indole-3-acetaldehyde oxidase n=1 Tax=Tarenaya hassleriana TaxID=28532 RepID=UPI00053C94C0|nr:PREDICTED: indole-3-acetaldehyde oxidase [Tarenaya hassleriana]
MSLVFAINGERFELYLSSLDPSTTLLEFLRYQTPFKSVKLSCGEGGCGACVVLMSKYDPVLNRVEDFTISSCLTLLCSIDRCSITTSEGLGNSRDGFHPIHQRFAGFHASQCGFCTPGMCVSLFSALLDAEKTSSCPETSPGVSKMTVLEAEKAVSGNLCRCTGYRPIVDACKSFASDVDIEDLGFNSFWRKGNVNKEEMLRRLPRYDRNNDICTFPKFLKDEIKSEMVSDPKKYRWCSPTSVQELQSLLETCKATNGVSVKLVAGNTGTGYYKAEKDQKYDKYIDLTRIPELKKIQKTDAGFEIGAAATISKVIKALNERKEFQIYPYMEQMFGKLASHMEKIASRFIRNLGSIGGNLMMAQRKQFPSDMATILLAADATVNIMSSRGLEKITLEKLLERDPLESCDVLLSVEIPFWDLGRYESFPEADSEFLFETYRGAPRPLGNGLAYLNAAFLAEISYNETLKGTTVRNCRLAFGAYGTKHAIRCKVVEKFLSGKVISDDVLYKAIELLRDTVVPKDGTTSPDYRSSLAVGFLFEFFHPLTQSRAKPSNGSLNGYKNGFHPNSQKTLPMLSSTQHVIVNDEYYPVGEPVIKAGASLQASGEAVYVDDIPSPLNCLYGAFIYSTRPKARIKGIHFEDDSSRDGVLDVISCKDIPAGGQNIGAKAFFSSESLFADEITQCVGQIVALVVANTQRNADRAANLAVVEYETEDLEPPILSVEDAVEKSSFFPVPPFLYPQPVGDTSKGMAEAEHRILNSEVRLGSQYFFYMETQTALAVPDEDKCMVIYSSIQNPQFAHSTIAACLGVPEHNIRVITRRVGGGFGGKTQKAIPVATACAVAANTLQRPVRIYVNRKTDMIMTGGRHPMKITYSVGFKSSGKITALELEILVDAGAGPDISAIIPSNIIGALKKYNWGTLSFNVKLCRTNLPSRTTMRAPGDLQGTYIAEAIIEHVASTLSMDTDIVREINLHTYESLALFYKGGAGEPHEYTLPSMWDRVAVSSDFEKRVSMIEEFNGTNEWRKRGISRVPITYQVALFSTPGRVSILNDGSIAVEVGGIELGQGLWTKVKQMVAYALGPLQSGRTEEILEKIRVIQSDSLSMIQGNFTGGSTTSEGSCEAVRLCCNSLVERLKPLKETLMQRSSGPVNWNTLITQAYAQSVNLSASNLYTPDYTSSRYLNYGTAVSEVEIDLLTGQTTVLRTDIVYDCGKSLNPAVDLGQIEGSFIQGLGFFMLEEYTTNSDGLVLNDSTWTYKIPTTDTIPRQFNVDILNSGNHEKRVLSSKASGEPPLLLAVSVHCATLAAAKEARKQLRAWKSHDDSGSMFQLPIPATMPAVKEICGLHIVESYLEWKIRENSR